MIINDIHHHVALSPTTYGSEYSFDAFLRERNKVSGATVVFTLPNHRKLYPCQSDHHYRVVPKAGSNCELRYECCNCGTISYEGGDPFRSDNERLLSLCDCFPKVFPYIFLTLCENTIENEFHYFCQNYENRFYGIKVHPNLCCKRVSDISFNSKYPIIIHAGMQPEDNPDDIIKFAERYDGNVLIAHMARCKMSALRRIKDLPNTYIDTSPTYLATQICHRFTSRYYTSDLFDVTSKADVFKRLIDIVGLDKVIFGSDAPFGSVAESINLFNELDLPEEYKTAIFVNNFYRFNTML